MKKINILQKKIELDFIPLYTNKKTKIMSYTKHLNELKALQIHQPPQEWLDDIEKEKQEIKNSFYFNNFDVWEIIRSKAKEMEDKETLDIINAKKEWDRLKRIASYEVRYSNSLTSLADMIRNEGFKCVPSYWDVYIRREFLLAWVNYKHARNLPILCLMEFKKNHQYEPINGHGFQFDIYNDSHRSEMDISCPSGLIPYFEAVFKDNHIGITQLRSFYPNNKRGSPILRLKDYFKKNSPRIEDVNHLYWDVCLSDTLPYHER